MRRSGGLSLRMDGVRYPGNPPCSTLFPERRSPPDLQNKPAAHVPTRSFLDYPGAGDDIHGELSLRGTPRTRRGCPAARGRPRPCTGRVDCPAEPGHGCAFFLFNPMNPDGGPRPLRAGDYVIMRSSGKTTGTAILRSARSMGYRPHPATTVGSEMHPIDWIVRPGAAAQRVGHTVPEALIADPAAGSTANSTNRRVPLSRPQPDGCLKSARSSSS